MRHQESSAARVVLTHGFDNPVLSGKDFFERGCLAFAKFEHHFTIRREPVRCLRRQPPVEIQSIRAPIQRQPGIMVAHSMGNAVFRYFLEWLRMRLREEAYQKYIKSAERRARAMLKAAAAKSTLKGTDDVPGTAASSFRPSIRSSR